MLEPSDTPASTASGTRKMATAGKRGHTTTPDNPIFTTPAKPQSKGDKENDAEPEDEIYTEFQQAQAHQRF